MEKKKPILPTIKKMEVGDIETWDIERFDTVRVLVGNFKRMNRRKQVDFSIKTVGLVVEVTRTA